MTTITPTTDVALPPGADSADIAWEAGEGDRPAYRCVWSEPSEDRRLDIRAVVVQFADGTIASEGEDGPLVYVGCEDYAPTEARALAAAIIAAADLADRWIGGEK